MLKRWHGAFWNRDRSRASSASRAAGLSRPPSWPVSSTSVWSTPCASVTYQGREQTGGEEVLKAIEGDGDGWLVVDDLVDTGNTATIIRNMLPKAHFATLYSKPAGKPLVDTFITEVSQDTWILFPWDSEVQYTAPLVEQN